MWPNHGIVLAGPPGAGKDTLTKAAAAISPLRLAKKLKVGAGRSAGYELVTAEHLQGLRARGEIASVVERYGNVYAISWKHLEETRANGLIPTVHTASIDEAKTLAARGFFVVVLWCERQEADARLRARNPDEVNARLAIWDEFQCVVSELGSLANAVVDTSGVTVDQAVAELLSQIARPLEPTEISRRVFSLFLKT